MKTSIARFSYERRVKLILIILAAVFVLFAIPSLHVSAENEPQPERSRTNLVRTSYSADNFVIFECAGNSVTARGKFTFDKVAGMSLLGCDETTGSFKFRTQKDGSFEAEITVVPPKDGESAVYLKMSSGIDVKYLIFYDPARGWYFPVNELVESNRKVFDHIYEAPAEAAALYLSSNDDPAEINSALEKISEIAQKVTEGMDDDYEKARAISLYVTNNICYDFDARDKDADLSTIALYNVLERSRTVCGGFANLFCAMAEAVGIDAVNIKGGVTSGSSDRPVSYDQLGDGVQNHEFAAFWYEKEDRWVWADACWDGCGSYNNGKYSESHPKTQYFDISDEVLSFNHRADKAERRNYFAAKSETQIITEPAAQSGESSEPAGSEEETAVPGDTTAEGMTALSQSEKPEQTTAAVSAGESSAAVGTAANGSGNKFPQEDRDTIYIVIIAALICAVAAAAAILIKVIINGRKK